MNLTFFVCFTEMLKDPKSFQLLGISGFVVFISIFFFPLDFCPIWAEINFKDSHFPTNWESSFFG